MAKTKLADDAGYRLLAAVVMQARKDIYQKQIDAADRASAWELFRELGRMHGISTRQRGDHRGGARRMQGHRRNVQTADGSMPSGVEAQQTATGVTGNRRL